MKNFMLDRNGDVIIKDGNIQMVEGTDLKAQTFRQVIGTKLGEWKYDESEGMDFSVLLTKHYNVDMIQEAIETAVKQVDDNAQIHDFSCDIKERKAEISFYIKTEGQELYMLL